LQDVRLLDEVSLSLDGTDLELVRSATGGAARQEFGYIARGLGDLTTDPTVQVDRVRQLDHDRLVERVVVSSAAQDEVSVTVRVRTGADLARMEAVKQGKHLEAAPVVASPHGVRFGDDRTGCTVTASPSPEVVLTQSPELIWQARLECGDRFEVRVEARGKAPGQFGPGRPAPWRDRFRVESSDLRIRRTVEQSLADLEGLLMRDGEEQFLAAGSPWFLTLFGRDSLWAARMLVPIDHRLALSTLRVLARRQGTRHDLIAEEQPGKMLHEVRNEVLDLGDQQLPQVYYGTVDATPLFVCTLADAFEWGADRDSVAELLPVARRCLEWVMAESAEVGWLRYVDHSGHGLVNQGWKDSSDSVQFADGRLADPPIALCEVQAYAYESGVRGAALLAAYDQPPVPGLIDWAADLRRRFTRGFWVNTPQGGHLAIALDGSGVPVDSVTSNLGHVLGTGILEPDLVARLVQVLTEPDMDSGFGLRTLSTCSPRFSRLSYHGGAVWPHDTAIAVRGLAAEGYLEEAAGLTAGLIAAAEGFGYRLPELYGGDAATDVPGPSAYPAACRPQAWSAAAPLAALVALSGIQVDAATGTVTHAPVTGTALGPFRLDGLRLGGRSISVDVTADGTVSVGAYPAVAVRATDSGVAALPTP
jgi:hypothetical protein